jgi:hypothetical protein
MVLAEEILPADPEHFKTALLGLLVSSFSTICFNTTPTIDVFEKNVVKNRRRLIVGGFKAFLIFSFL